MKAFFLEAIFSWELIIFKKNFLPGQIPMGLYQYLISFVSIQADLKQKRKINGQFWLSVSKRRYIDLGDRSSEVSIP